MDHLPLYYLTDDKEGNAILHGVSLFETTLPGQVMGYYLIGSDRDGAPAPGRTWIWSSFSKGGA